MKVYVVMQLKRLVRKYWTQNRDYQTPKSRKIHLIDLLSVDCNDIAIISRERSWVRNTTKFLVKSLSNCVSQFLTLESVDLDSMKDWTRIRT